MCKDCTYWEAKESDFLYGSYGYCNAPLPPLPQWATELICSGVYEMDGSSGQDCPIYKEK